MAVRGEKQGHPFKIVIVGDSGVGKSCLLLRFADDAFSETYISTIGVDFRFRTVKTKGKTIKLQIWDTAGQERFRTITSAYYRGADGIIVVYDVSCHDSFIHCKDWIAEIERNAGTDSSILLVGNKCDKLDRAVPTAMAQAYADSISVPFLESSAKTSYNVERAFTLLTSSLLAKKEAKNVDAQEASKNTNQSGQEQGSSDKANGAIPVSVRLNKLAEGIFWKRENNISKEEDGGNNFTIKLSKQNVTPNSLAFRNCC